MHGTPITIAGNIGTHPEHKVTAAGVSIMKFRVGASERRFDRETQAWIDGPTSWYAVSIFRDLADHAFHSLSKGDRVILSGRLRIRSWESGGKQGTDADVEVDAIGHDLRWGTTRFERTRRGGSQSEPAPVDGWSGAQAVGSDDTDAPAAADAWAVPDSPAELDEHEPARVESPF